jgi:hypothetical protein
MSVKHAVLQTNFYTNFTNVISIGDINMVFVGLRDISVLLLG